VAARRWGPNQAQSLGILVALVCGAAAAATLISHARAWLPVVQLLPLMIVEAAGLRLMRLGRRDAANMTAARLPK